MLTILAVSSWNNVILTSSVLPGYAQLYVWHLMYFVGILAKPSFQPASSAAFKNDRDAIEFILIEAFLVYNNQNPDYISA